MDIDTSNNDDPFSRENTAPPPVNPPPNDKVPTPCQRCLTIYHEDSRQEEHPVVQKHTATCQECRENIKADLKRQRET